MKKNFFNVWRNGALNSSLHSFLEGGLLIFFLGVLLTLILVATGPWASGWLALVGGIVLLIMAALVFIGLLLWVFDKGSRAFWAGISLATLTLVFSDVFSNGNLISYRGHQPYIGAALMQNLTPVPAHIYFVDGPVMGELERTFLSEDSEDMEEKTYTVVLKVKWEVKDTTELKKALEEKGTNRPINFERPIAEAFSEVLLEEGPLVNAEEFGKRLKALCSKKAGNEALCPKFTIIAVTAEISEG